MGNYGDYFIGFYKVFLHFSICLKSGISRVMRIDLYHFQITKQFIRIDLHYFQISNHQMWIKLYRLKFTKHKITFQRVVLNSFYLESLSNTSFVIRKTHNHIPTRRFEFTLFRITLKYVVCDSQNTKSLSNASFWIHFI